MKQILLALLLFSSGAHAQTITLNAVGDILLDRRVGQKIAQHGTSYPFAKTRDLLRNADITFGNLECPLSKTGTPIVKQFVFKARPEYSWCLRDGGFDILSLANNHTLDCGRTGLTETMHTLQQQNIRWCGAGENRSAAESTTLLNIKGVSIAFVGFCEFLPEGIFVNDAKPSIAFASVENVKRAVSNARKQADVVVASFHWGIEYSHRPTDWQKQLAHIAAQSGADLVLGHHPHVLQGFETVQMRDASTRRMRRTLIAYSLGNFVFDPPPQRGSAPTETMILQCRLNKTGVQSASVIPMKIVNHRPQRATTQQAATTLQRLKNWSRSLGVSMRGAQVL